MTVQSFNIGRAVVTSLAIWLTLLLAACRPSIVDTHPGLRTSAGLSHLLSYSIQFSPSAETKEASFAATLTNVCPDTLNIQLNDKKFRASFIVTPETGPGYKIYDREYYGMLVSATWSEPIIALEPLKSVTWIVPLSSLAGEQNTPVTQESLSGCTLTSEMVMAIVSKSKGSLSDNATQRSSPIKIPPSLTKGTAFTPHHPLPSAIPFRNADPHPAAQAGPK